LASFCPICVAASAETSSLSFDLERTLRRLKPSRSLAPLTRRPPDALPLVDGDLRPGGELLLDTTVYIDTLQDRCPDVAHALLMQWTCNHSSVCVAELTHAFGRLDPRHPGTAGALRGIGRIIAGMPAHRVGEPSQSAWGGAGIVAGMAFRLGGYQAGQERKLLNDALLYLQALEHGMVVLSGNLRDFDLLNQIVPEGRILLYQQAGIRSGVG
jgi:hypothetical protein